MKVYPPTCSTVYGTEEEKSMGAVSEEQIRVSREAQDITVEHVSAVKQDLALETITSLPLESEARKGYPIHSGVLRYFPAALAEVSRVSKFGNDKHCPDGPLTHMRGKSMDHRDCLLRHLIDHEDDPIEPESGLPQLAFVAWRALAVLQEYLETEGLAPYAPAATYPLEADA